VNGTLRKFVETVIPEGAHGHQWIGIRTDQRTGERGHTIRNDDQAVARPQVSQVGGAEVRLGLRSIQFPWTSGEGRCRSDGDFTRVGRLGADFEAPAAHRNMPLCGNGMWMDLEVAEMV
jgi:hypothetical protein